LAMAWATSCALRLPLKLCGATNIFIFVSLFRYWLDYSIVKPSLLGFTESLVLSPGFLLEFT